MLLYSIILTRSLQLSEIDTNRWNITWFGSACSHRCSESRSVHTSFWFERLFCRSSYLLTPTGRQGIILIARVICIIEPFEPLYKLEVILILPFNKPFNRNILSITSRHCYEDGLPYRLATFWKSLAVVWNLICTHAPSVSLSSLFWSSGHRGIVNPSWGSMRLLTWERQWY